MADGPDSGLSPEDLTPPTAVADVDSLLQQAETLAEEIATTAGVEAGERQHGAAPQTTALDETDPVAVAEAVVHEVEQIDAIIADSESYEAADPPIDAPPEEARRQDLPPAEIIEEVEEAQAPPDDESVSLPPDGDNSEPLDGGPYGGLDEVSGARTSARRRPLAVAKVILKAGGNAGTVALNTFLRLLVVLDRPFQKLSPQAKLYIGFLGIFTILMGILSFVLPPLLEHNPYADMPP